MEKEIEKELLSKKLFVEYLSEALVKNAIPCIQEVNYEVLSKDSGYVEFIIVTYKGGAIAVRNSTHNSKQAIFREIGKLLDGGYYTEVPYYKSLLEQDWIKIL